MGHWQGIWVYIAIFAFFFTSIACVHSVLSRILDRIILRQIWALTYSDRAKYFMTDNMGRVMSVNPSAQCPKSKQVGKTLQSVLKPLLGNPHASLSRLRRMMVEQSHVSEIVLTEHGQLRLSAWRQNRQRILWRIHIKTGGYSLDQALDRDRATIPAGEYISVTVTDEGCGIATDKLTKIFEPFYSTKRTGEGTGLGLSTVYGIVKQTGGYIFVQSAEGQGTEFNLILPIFDGQRTEIAPVIEEPKIQPRTYGDGVILLVEDEAPVRTFASRALQLRGYKVIEAASAEEALDQLSDPNLQIDVFVTDIAMPGRDGPSWVKEALEQRPNTRVVFVSGYAEDVLETQQAAIPNSVFLRKPFSLDDLTETVQQQFH